MREDLSLIAVALVIIAGAIASGLGQLASVNDHGQANFPVMFGSGVMAVGCLLFVVIMLSSGKKSE